MGTNERFVAVKGERAWCRFYALDPTDSGLVAVAFLTTAREVGLRVAARIVGNAPVVLENGVVLKRQPEVEVPFPSSGEEPSVTRYRPSYVRSAPVRLETGTGYETCVLHRDATVEASPGHRGYLIRLLGEDEAQFRRRFFYLWGRVTELPARPEWASSLWKMGERLGLITPLEASNCQGWCIDPRRDLPDGAGWGHVLQILVQLKEARK